MRDWLIVPRRPGFGFIRTLSARAHWAAAVGTGLADALIPVADLPRGADSAERRFDLLRKFQYLGLPVDRSTVSGAVRQISPLLAARGFAVPDRPGIRLRTLEDVFAYTEAEGVKMRIDGTDVQVRRPAAGKPGRKAFISGKRKQNTIKTTTFTDGQGRTLFSGVARPGRMHDQTAVRTEGVAEVDEGCRGLADEFPEQVSAPPKPMTKDTEQQLPLGERYARRETSTAPVPGPTSTATALADRSVDGRSPRPRAAGGSARWASPVRRCRRSAAVRRRAVSRPTRS